MIKPNIDMMLNILITGANGQLGSEIRRLASEYEDYTCLFTDLAELDISDRDSVLKFVDNHKINVIINAAAYTAVDKAETEPDLANRINGTAVSYLAEAAQSANALLIHISTDYIFDGRSSRPVGEDQIPSPQGAYARSKLIGEQVIRKQNCRSVILRTSWLYSEFGNNFVKTIMRIGASDKMINVVFDQVGSPTYACDLAKVILGLIPVWKNQSGIEILNYSNEGVASWYDFAKAILEFAGIECKVNPIETKDYPLPAVRPFYSLLNKARIKSTYNLEIPHWRDSLKECIGRIISK